MARGLVRPRLLRGDRGTPSKHSWLHSIPRRHTVEMPLYRDTISGGDVSITSVSGSLYTLASRPTGIKVGCYVRSGNPVIYCGVGHLRCHAKRTTVARTIRSPRLTTLVRLRPSWSALGAHRSCRRVQGQLWSLELQVGAGSLMHVSVFTEPGYGGNRKLVQILKRPSGKAGSSTTFLVRRKRTV